ncbi:MAG: hypothetical protein ACKOKC_16690, partial [Chthoniobacterales bacterium]
PVLVLKVTPLGSDPAFNRHPRIGGWDAVSETEPALLRTNAGESGEPEVTIGGCVCARSEDEMQNVAANARDDFNRVVEEIFMATLSL